MERTDHSENSKEILAASNNFELFIAQKLYTVYGEAVRSSFSNYLKPYMVRHHNVLNIHDKYFNVWNCPLCGALLRIREKNGPSSIKLTHAALPLSWFYLFINGEIIFSY